MSRNPFADDTPLFDAPPGEEPLFLHPTSRDRMIENVIGSGVGVFVALTFIFSLITGFGKSSNNLFLGVSLVSFALVTVQLIRWYRHGDLDPKFKLLILTLIASLVLLSIVANVYFWSPSTVIDPRIEGCKGVWKVDTSDCWSACAKGTCLDMSGAAPGECKAC